MDAEELKTMRAVAANVDDDAYDYIYRPTNDAEHAFVKTFRPRTIRLLLDAIADARAAGYAEAIEACIQECEIEICELTKGPLISNHATYPYNLMMQRFRALAPATTKEPK